MWRGVLRLQALTLLAVGALAAPRVSAAQFVAHVRWPLVDVLVRGDVEGRFEVVASPNLSSNEGTGPKTRLSRFSLAPVDALQWGMLMRRLVDSVARLPRTPAVIMLRPPLREINDTLDQIVLGAAIEADKPRFRFIVADDNPEHAWQTAITADETHQFLDAITAIAGAIVVPERRGVQLSAAPDISFCPIPDATLTTEESVETPPRLLSGKLEYPESQRLQNRSGRVLVQFVIDTTGRVAPQSECVLITDHEDFTAAVLRALPRFRFKPGTAGGIRVPVSVCQEYRFSIGRP